MIPTLVKKNRKPARRLFIGSEKASVESHYCDSRLLLAAFALRKFIGTWELLAHR
jgi:hypothetical protein